MITSITILLIVEGPTQDAPKKTTMVCDKKTKIDDFHYFTAIDKSDPHDKDVCQGDSGGTYTIV